MFCFPHPTEEWTGLLVYLINPCKLKASYVTINNNKVRIFSCVQNKVQRRRNVDVTSMFVGIEVNCDGVYAREIECMRKEVG